MAQVKHLTRDGIAHIDEDNGGRLHYGSGLRPAFIACGKTRELARNTAYVLGDTVIKILADGATAIYHVYECTTAGTTHATTPATGFATGAALKHPSTGELTDGTAGFTFSYTPDQAHYVDGMLHGRFVAVRGTSFYDRQYVNGQLHSDDDYADAEYTGSNGTSTFVRGSYYIDGVKAMSVEGAVITAPETAVLLTTNEGILTNEGWTAPE